MDGSGSGATLWHYVATPRYLFVESWYVIICKDNGILREVFWLDHRAAGPRYQARIFRSTYGRAAYLTNHAQAAVVLEGSRTIGADLSSLKARAVVLFSVLSSRIRREALPVDSGAWAGKS